MFSEFFKNLTENFLKILLKMLINSIYNFYKFYIKTYPEIADNFPNIFLGNSQYFIEIFPILYQIFYRNLIEIFIKHPQYFIKNKSKFVAEPPPSKFWFRYVPVKKRNWLDFVNLSHGRANELIRLISRCNN